MPTIVADHDVEGHLQLLLNIWLSPDWHDVWTESACEVESFERLGIDPSASDQEIWRLCQERGFILITGNRNAEGDESLEVTIRRETTPGSLPVFTIGDPTRMMRDHAYAEQVAARLIERCHDIDQLRGTGRLYLT